MRADPGAPAASRTRLPCLPRHCAPGAAVRRRSPRSRRHAGDRDRRADLRLGALDPRQQARSPGCAAAAYQWCADPSPQYPRTALLPLRRMPLLTHPMLDQLGQLGLSGMAQAFAELALARGDGRYARILRGLTGVQLLILDDWGLEPLDAGARRDLYEILEERYGRRSTILTSQIPVDKWHAFIGDPTYADAILDRLVHNAHRIDLAGESLRRKRSRSIAKD